MRTRPAGGSSAIRGSVSTEGGIVSTPTIAAALEALASVIRADADKARAKAVPATARLLDGLRCEVTGPRGESMRTDMPSALGGTASAPNPGWLLRGALASCLTTVAAMRAARLGIELRTLEVTVESESDHRGLLGMDERVAAGFTALRMRVRIGADGVAPATLRELVKWGDAHAPVCCTVREPPLAAVEVEVV
jgi:uncharacterized OsmC-like protein